MKIINSYTLKTLKKNKTRTLVTIIGIILSAAMLTAVTTFISSLQGFLVDTVIDAEGDWHGAEIGVDSAGLDYIGKSGEVESLVYLGKVGYARIAEIENEYKPYLYIAGMSDGFADRMPVHLISGRLPENSSELLLPKHLHTNGGVKYALGDALTLELGDRVQQGETLSQYVPFFIGENGEILETLEVSSKREYTVVGFYERPNFEDYSAPGYTALTVDEGSRGSYDVYFKMHDPKNSDTFIERFSESGNTAVSGKVNLDLLRMYGSSSDSEYNAVLYGLGAVLIAIIMFASVSLIYNAFSISVSERTKQFGIISSVGATKKQLFRSVLFEALTLSIVGIPLGILAGIAGIGVTLAATKGLFNATFAVMNTSAQLTLRVTALSVIAAAAVGLLTVLISAYIPAKRAVKLSAMEAIRQTTDVKIKPGKVKTGKLTYKLFGLEGMIASKNFKRNRKKYRTTVISLFMSIVLFMSAGSLVAYLKRGVDDIIDDYDCDIYYQAYDSESEQADNQLFKALKDASSVTKASCVYSIRCVGVIDKKLIESGFLEYSAPIDKWIFNTGDENLINQNVEVVFIDDDSYRDYLTEKGLDVEKYMNSKSPVALASDSVKAYNSEDGRYRAFKVFTDKSFEMSMDVIKDFDSYGFAYFEPDSTGTGLEYVFMPQDTWDEDEAMRLSSDEACDTVTVNVGGVTDEAFALGTGLGVRLMYPKSAMKQIVGDKADGAEAIMLFNSRDYAKTYDEMYATLDKLEYSTFDLINLAEQATVNRAIITIANVFAYGFITLISLIAVANVFNTITTNINLRRREFATLRSVGMTGKGFRKMMNLECLLYGIKSLLYGLPVSFGITFVIYMIINNGIVSSFFIPWYNVAIVVISVFAVVFITMLYAMRKINKEDTVDALKNENL